VTATRRRGAGRPAALAEIADAIPVLARTLAARAPAGPRGERARNLLAGLLALPAARRPSELPEVFAAFERELTRLEGDAEAVHESLRALVHEHHPVLLGDPALAHWIEAPHRQSSMLTWLLHANASRLEQLQGELGDRIAETAQLREEVDRLKAEHGAVIAELERRRTLSDIGMIAAGVVHDFNNVLHVISGHAGAVRARAGGRDAQSMDHVLEAALRASEMTHRLLLWLRHSAPAPEPVDLGAVAGEVLDLLGPSAPARVLLVRRFEPGLPAVFADPVDLRRVVLNLVVNAWEACGERPGQVVVATGAATGRRTGAWLEVADDGRGMDAGTCARVFEPFFSTRSDGTGLGLSLVREIVDRLGGEIEVASRPGEGSRFRVTLAAMGR
jgi:signal transduction histidine kinase